MLIKTLTVTNTRGDSLTFGYHFKLLEDFNISGLPATVSYSESTKDGSSYQNTKLNNRELEISFYLDKIGRDSVWVEEKRNELYKVFNPKTNPLKLSFETKGNGSFYLMANAEAVPTFANGRENQSGTWSKGLIQLSSHDPYIYVQEETKVDIATWFGSFEFPLEIIEPGIDLGYRSQSLIVNVWNEGQESTGLLLRFKALGTVTNPSLFNVNTQEYIKLNATLVAGDVVEVSTYTGKKRIDLIRNGVKSSLFNALDIQSTFLQLDLGDNLFRYDADDNVDGLEVSITFTPRLLGV